MQLTHHHTHPQKLRDAVATTRKAKEIYGFAADFAQKFPNLSWPRADETRRKRVKAVHDIVTALSGNDPGKLLTEYLNGRYRIRDDSKGERIQRRIRAMLKGLHENKDEH